MKPKEQRRYVERRYRTTIIRELFNIPDKEMILDIKWDRSNNVIVVETLLDYNKNKGDIWFAIDTESKRRKRMNQEDKQTIKDCIEILTNNTSNYQKTALQLRSVLKRNDII